MKISMIGSGNLATNLADALFKSGHDIVNISSSNIHHATMLAERVGGLPVDDLSRLSPLAEVFILSVSDAALPTLIPQLCKGREEHIFLHTAGSMPMNVFEGMALHYGVLYPMQTFSKQRIVDFSCIPCFIEANDEKTETAAYTLAGDISNRVYGMDSDARRYLHLAAVFACNFVNHCYALSADILESHGIPSDVMLPLIDETALKVHGMSPQDAQTGPAVRYDENVLRKQSQLLRDNPLVKEIYDRMSLSIHNQSKKE